MFKLSTPIQYLKGVGPKYAAVLNAAGLFTIEDLLHYKPFRYEDRTNFKSIKSLRDGEYAVVRGEITLSGVYSTRKSGIKIFEMAVRDESGFVNVKFFNQPYLKSVLKEGRRVIVYGQAKYDTFKLPSLCFINPEYEIVEEDKDSYLHTGRVVPVYKRIGELTGKSLRKMIYTAIEQLSEEPFDPLPDYLKNRHQFGSKRKALIDLHVPQISNSDFLAKAQALEDYNSGRSPAHTQLIFEEFFQLQVGLNYLRRQRKQEIKGRTYQINDRVREAIKKMLVFHPTQAQKRVLKEIVDDMCSPKPMHRLLQGDVGCGKTVVALQAMILAIENGYQTALMAPTEILAEQHAFTVKNWLSKTGYRSALVTGSVKKSAKEQIKHQIADGAIDLVIGTHALIQEEVRFKNLGFVVIDEQHRFGVLQRADLIKKGYNPDTLVMTATPIPRSLSLTVYGDLDVSVIDELPSGRLPVRTLLKTERDRRQVYDMIREQVRKGHQVYVIYPLVEESEKLDLKAATQMAEHLARDVFPDVRVGLLHGQMTSHEKEEAMGRFAAGEINILVSTTVIEVGVDVANATLMVVEHAERFGLSQLHQLRGRVGRGTAQATCILLTDAYSSGDAQRRLQIMCQTNDGFKISEVDLEIRGPGELAGTKQSGLPEFKFGNIVRDRRLLELARAEAEEFLGRVSDGGDTEIVKIFSYIKSHWQSRFGLTLVG